MYHFKPNTFKAVTVILAITMGLTFYVYVLMPNNSIKKLHDIESIYRKDARKAWDSLLIINVHDKVKADIETKATTYYDSFLLKEPTNAKEAFYYLKLHLQYRDSIDKIKENKFIDHIDDIQSYRKQKELIQAAKKSLIHDRIMFYRITITTFILIFILLVIVFRIKKRKQQLELNLEHEKNERAQAENKFLKEQEERKRIEIAQLNLTVEYYKRLNTMTVPILLKRQNKLGSVFLDSEEWDIVVKNTNACFNDFTVRLKNSYPQLEKDDIMFCCLIKMELSLSFLAEIYHIEKGSISRKKMRLKERMNIKDLTFDEFIHSF
ncbi:MAG: hypothetical protein RRY36_08840 [Bacteroidaceae bacterium]